MSTTVSASTAPPSLGEIARRVESRMDELLAGEFERWRRIDPQLEAPFTALRELVLAGGKRLRPAFCHWAYVGSGGDPLDPQVIDAGVALELLHTFALIHDDIMDGSATRRTMDTIHVTFERLHGQESWRGEGRRFGEGVGILVGDLAFVYADRMLAGAPSDALDIFTELRLEVNVGQYLDLVGTARGQVDEESARRICSFKSGKYTIERPLHLGAALAGELEPRRAALSAYGLPLGEAFQLRDDLLGVFGDSDVTGKPVGEDVREGKPTILFAFATRLAGAGSQSVLSRYGAPDVTAEEIAALQQLFADSGAVAMVEARIDDLVAQAVGALGDVKLEPQAVTALTELAYYVAGRDH